MIKETKSQQEVITQRVYCDVCGAEIRCRLLCMKATCEYCKNDLCEKCIGHEEETGGDYREVWCTACWQIGSVYRPKINELEAEVYRLYEAWQSRCKDTQ